MEFGFLPLLTLACLVGDI